MKLAKMAKYKCNRKANVTIAFIMLHLQREHDKIAWKFFFCCTVLFYYCLFQFLFPIFLLPNIALPTSLHRCIRWRSTFSGCRSPNQGKHQFPEWLPWRPLTLSDPILLTVTEENSFFFLSGFIDDHTEPWDSSNDGPFGSNVPVFDVFTIYTRFLFFHEVPFSFLFSFSLALTFYLFSR